MSDHLTPEERFAHEDESDFVPRDLESGLSEDEIVLKLTRLEWPQDRAREYVRQFRRELDQFHGSPEERDALRDYYFRQMLAGGVIAIFGTGLAVISFISVMAGGMGVFSIGAILIGAIMFSSGYSRWSKYSDDSPNDDQSK